MSLQHIKLPPMKDERTRRGALLLFLLIGWALRIWDWHAFPYHPDEAIYGYWARLISSGRDPWLFSVYVDKPPFFIYSLAAAFRLLGVKEASARIPNIFASFALLPVLWSLFRRWYGDSTALISLILISIAPFEFLFAPTAFTDPFLSLWVFTAMLGIASGNFFLAGAAGGLAYASKQQSVLFIPIAMFALFKQSRRTGDWLRFLAGLSIPFAIVTWWDSLRWAFKPSFWDRSIVTYGGIYLEPPTKWPEKSLEMAKLLGRVFSTWPAALISIGLLLYLLTKTFHRWREWDFGVSAFSLAYLILHIIVDFQIWDRYILPIFPLLLVSALRGIQVLKIGKSRAWQSRFQVFIALALACFIAAGIPSGLGGKLPIGGEHRLHQGIAEAASFFEKNAPKGSVLYHHWLGWYWDYYLFDDDVDLRYYFTPEYLADNAKKVLPRPAFLVIPSWENGKPIKSTLGKQGILLETIKKFHRKDGSLSFTMYRLAKEGQ